MITSLIVLLLSLFSLTRGKEVNGIFKAIQPDLIELYTVHVYWSVNSSAVKAAFDTFYSNMPCITVKDFRLIRLVKLQHLAYNILRLSQDLIVRFCHQLKILTPRQFILVTLQSIIMLISVIQVTVNHFFACAATFTERPNTQ
jgi:hypothetical protein